MDIQSTPLSFDTINALGVELHNAHNDKAALEQFTQAYYVASETGEEVQAAQALRDAASSHLRLGEYDQAQTAAEESTRLLREADEVPGRELYGSSARLAQIAACLMVDAETRDTKLPAFLRSNSLSDEFRRIINGLRSLEKSGEPDQYRIIFSSKFAVAYGFEGRRRRAFLEGMKSAALGLRSESPKLPTANRDLGMTGRTKAKVKHIGGGLLAATTAITPRPVTRRLVKKVMS